MNFTLNDDRRMLQDMLTRFLTERYGFEVRNAIAESVGGYSKEIWQQFGELGVIGALFAEAEGGFGGDAFDLAVVFEQLGQALVVEPFLATVMARQVLAQAGGHEDLMGRLVSGDAVVAVAIEEPETHYDVRWTATEAKRSDTGWVLSGTKSVVAHAGAADAVIVAARTAGVPGDEAGLSLFLVPGSAMAPQTYQLIDGGPGGDIHLAGIVVPDSAMLGGEGEGFAIADRAIDAGIVALCWEAVGIMMAVRDGTIDYLRTRIQSGKPIGKFQALQHRMATVALEIEQARSAAINAAAALNADYGPARSRVIAAAKHTIGKAGAFVAEEAIQMHGGIGMTWEFPLSHFAKRLILIDHQLGDEDFYLQRYLALAAA